ncbi:MAG TPA: hypothetical protein ENN65_05950 [Candidatus Hydrogenedentes bacterium]|nr:hypothetical protein [Candidatus Hydrogenedentota bacterium]
MWLQLQLAVPRDEANRREQWRLLLERHAATANELAEDYGLEAKEWGDEPLVPISVMPISDVFRERKPESEGQSQQRRADRPTPQPRPELPALVSPTLPSPPPPLTADQAARALRVFVRGASGVERPFARALRSYYEDARERALAGWDSVVGDAEQGAGAEVTLQPLAARALAAALDPEAETMLLAATARPFAARAMIVGAQVQAGILDVPLGPFGDPDPFADAVAARYYSTADTSYWRDLTMRQQNEIRDAVMRSQASGGTYSDLREAMVGMFGEFSSVRAGMIAATETTKYANAGMQAHREQLALPWKEWVATFINTRDSHAAVHGTRVRTEDFFTVGADRMLFPGQGTRAEEVVNCGCMAIARAAGS